MKKLTNVISKVEGKKVTITADIEEWAAGDFLRMVQQTTVGFVNPENLRWPRHIQISQEATFVKAFGNCVAIRHEDLVAIAAAVEPKTTYPPKFNNVIGDGLEASVSSEINPDFQWQTTDDIKLGKWDNVEGQTSPKLDRSKVSGNRWYRLVASSDAGEMVSNAILVK